MKNLRALLRKSPNWDFCGDQQLADWNAHPSRWLEMGGLQICRGSVRNIPLNFQPEKDKVNVSLFWWEPGKLYGAMGATKRGTDLRLEASS